MSKQRGTVKNNHEASHSTGRSPKRKFAEMLLANEEIQKKENKRKEKDLEKYSSVDELMKSAKKKKNKSKTKK
jgi:hypothetical protein